MNPLVSIIIPCYKSEGYIRKCADSIIDQSYGNWEAIFAIDKPDLDNAESILSDYNESRFKINPCMEKGNPAKARNRGVSFAQGKYIAFLDADDWWVQDKLSRQINFLEINPDIDWTWSYAIIHSGSKEYMLDSHWDNPKAEETIPLQSIVLRKRLVEKIVLEDGYLFDESLPQIDDYDLYIRLKKFSNYCFREPFVHYRSHSKGLTTSSPQTEVARIQTKINIKRHAWENLPRILWLYAGYKTRDLLRPYKVKVDTFVGRHTRTLQIEPTTRCNLNCPKCSRGTDTPIVDITPTTLIHLLTTHKPRTVLLQGLGEPFMHPDFPHICQITKRNCNRVIVISNGTVINTSNLEDIDHIVISMDSVGNKIREQTIEDISLMGRPTIAVNFVRTADNFNMQKEVQDFCDGLGVHLFVTPVQNFYNPEEPEWVQSHNYVLTERSFSKKSDKPFRIHCPFLRGTKLYFDARGVQHPCCIRMRYDQVEPTPRMCETCPE